MPELLIKVRGEIEQRLGELRPLVLEYERMLDAADALGVGAERAGPPSSSGRAPALSSSGAAPALSSSGRAPRRARRKGAGKPTRARRGAAEHAIVAALEHGSHTVSKLVVVTAMSGPNIRNNLRRLLAARTVTQTKREGKAAYALSSPPS